MAYCEFRLAESDGLAPDPDAYFVRFPALRRVLAIHGAFASDAADEVDDFSFALPVVGDEIGPYRLVEELGRGGFARVFLAEQSDLEDRYVVVKVTTRRTPESRLLARARHSHIVEVLSHADVEGGLFQIICMPFLGGATLSAVLAERRRRGGRPAWGLDLLEDLDRASAKGYPAPGRWSTAREVIAGLSYTRAVAWIVARLAEALDHAYSRGVLHGDVKPSERPVDRRRRTDAVRLQPVGRLASERDRGRRHSERSGGHARLHGPRAVRRRLPRRDKSDPVAG